MEEEEGGVVRAERAAKREVEETCGGAEKEGRGEERPETEGIYERIVTLDSFVTVSDGGGGVKGWSWDGLL